MRECYHAKSKVENVQRSIHGLPRVYKHGRSVGNAEWLENDRNGVEGHIRGDAFINREEMFFDDFACEMTMRERLRYIHSRRTFLRARN